MEEPLRKPELERWTIDRLDRDENFVRVEIVPVRKGRLTVKEVARIEKDGPGDKYDKLASWDLARTRIEKRDLDWVFQSLTFRDSERETVSENMVFLRYVPPDPAKPPAFYYATRGARDHAKTLYKQLLGGKKS